MTKKVRPYGSSADIAALGRARHGKEHLSELASTCTVTELAMQAADAIAALNDLTSHDGDGTDLHSTDLRNAAEVRDVLAGLELMAHGLPRLCEQLTRFLVTHREDRLAGATDGALDDAGLAEVTDALTSAAQAADMLTDALDQARRATEPHHSLTPLALTAAAQAVERRVRRRTGTACRPPRSCCPIGCAIRTLFRWTISTVGISHNCGHVRTAAARRLRTACRESVPGTTKKLQMTSLGR